MSTLPPSPPLLSMSRRVRATPFQALVEAAGVKAFSVYNHMVIPTLFDTLEGDYWHLCEHVQVWDVSCQRQVELNGRDSNRLLQLMIPRDVSNVDVGQCLYAPLCDDRGLLINDPVAIRIDRQRWWLSIADSDVGLWARGLAVGLGLDVQIYEAGVWPLAVQGPKADELMRRVFGAEVDDIRFFRSAVLPFRGHPLLISRSGWSKQGGFEIYLNKEDLAEPLWRALFVAGEDLQIRAGCPNLIERIEAGLLSFGNDITGDDNPFQCTLDRFIDLDANVDSLSLPALRALSGEQSRQLTGLSFDQPLTQGAGFRSLPVYAGKNRAGALTSHAWSPRHQRYIALAMVESRYLAQDLRVNGQSARLHPAPFNWKT